MSSKAKAGPPKHQNRYAWKPNAGVKINETVIPHFITFRFLHLLFLLTFEIFYRRLEAGSARFPRSPEFAFAARTKSIGNAATASTNPLPNPPNGISLPFCFYLSLSLDCCGIDLMYCSQLCSKRAVRQAYHNLCPG